MSNAVVRKLSRGAPLTEDDRAALLAGMQNVRRIAPRTSLARDDLPDGLIVVLEGLLCRYKTLRDGRRQIVALLLPGDFCDVHTSALGALKHGLASVGPSTIAILPRARLNTWVHGSATLRQALDWAALVDESVTREWLVNLGARRANERTAHLFCELQARLQVVEEGRPTGYALPMTQEDLGDVLGLSVVHVNRTLAQLRASAHATFHRGAVQIPDLARLADYAGFSSDYLHLDPLGAAAQRALTAFGEIPTV